MVRREYGFDPIRSNYRFFLIVVKISSIMDQYIQARVTINKSIRKPPDGRLRRQIHLHKFHSLTLRGFFYILRSLPSSLFRTARQNDLRPEFCQLDGCRFTYPGIRPCDNDDLLIRVVCHYNHLSFFTLIQLYFLIIAYPYNRLLARNK